MILDEIYLFLKSAGRVKTHAAFSVQYLGHSARYYDYLRCAGAAPSLQSLIKLATHLSDIAHETGDDLNESPAGQLAKRVMSRALMRCR
ncbi:hypothetical protein F1C10_00270 [Sphingomonas sp. NBWT7]|uniref:DUF6626 family protein n=1 Tax=Sphingomonas sp. NBWT7 TaxID=2596913 RepID=UPI0016298496|nr:DUF6626 family protein [Sphingomonas sp. NBWT7]QNE30576.1 hypothetical protein F1C10_00270 [Sphingomonas sp. NBWT7]